MFTVKLYSERKFFPIIYSQTRTFNSEQDAQEYATILEFEYSGCWAVIFDDNPDDNY